MFKLNSNKILLILTATNQFLAQLSVLKILLNLSRFSDVRILPPFRGKAVKGSFDQCHFIFAIKAGKSRIRHRTTLTLNDVIFNDWSSMDFESI